MTEIIYNEVVSVHASNEWVSVVDAARISLTRDDILKILEMARVAQQAKLQEVSDFSYIPEYGFLDEDVFSAVNEDEEGCLGDQFSRTECNTVVVTGYGKAASVNWTALLKHSDISLSTDHIVIADLEALLPKGEPAAPEGQRAFWFDTESHRDAFIAGVEYVNDSALSIKSLQRDRIGQWGVFIADSD